VSLAREILIAAERFDGVPFDAGDIRELVEEQTERRWDRGVVSRQLGRMTCTCSPTQEQWDPCSRPLEQVGVRQRRPQHTIHYRLRQEQ